MVIYYRLSLFVILLLRFMVSPKSSSARRARPSRQVGLWAAAIPQAAAALPQVPGARGCHWILKRFLLSPCLRSSHFSSHPGYHFILHTCPAWKRWIVLNNGVITTEWQEQRDPAGSLGLGVIRRGKKKKKAKIPDSLWANLTPTVQLAQSTKKVGMSQVGHGLSIPCHTHLCLCFTEFLGHQKAPSSDLWADGHVTLERSKFWNTSWWTRDSWKK